jgi:lysozyme family protein
MSLPYSDPFPALIAPILVLEGGGELADNPADNGGPTIWGIDQEVAAAAGYNGDMGAITEAVAIGIYRQTYWQDPGFDLISPILSDLAAYLLEVGINIGPPAAGEFLQRALNVLSNQGKLYATVSVDGQCGPRTRAALTGYCAARPTSQSGSAVLLGVVRSLAVSNYISISEADPSQQAFTYGWIKNRALGLP